jgi:two-component sensor histidine kinase
VNISVATLPLSPDAQAILNADASPVFCLALSGVVEFANFSARTNAPAVNVGTRLDDFPGNEKMSLYLDRCSGSTTPLLGTIHLPTLTGSRERFVCHGNLIERFSNKLLLRCTRADTRFSALTNQIHELNREIRKHQHTQAVLEEALRDREVLIREVHHRVKNNVQMLAGMLSTSARETDSQEAREVLSDGSRRLRAMSVVQQTLYGKGPHVNTKADHFLETLIMELRGTWPAAVHLSAEIEPIDLPTDIATPLALIANELLTNAVKYGRGPRQDVNISFVFRRTEGGLELAVSDQGPGFELTDVGKQSSGLGLVRGLARQIGGSFEVTSSLGSKCRVGFQLPV